MTRDCEPDENLRCRHCGKRLAFAGLRRNCRAFGPPPQFSHATVKLPLPGTALKVLLAKWFGIRSNSGCGCDSRAAEMDARGPDWCEQNIDTIVGWLRDEAKQRGLPFLDAAGRLLVRKAIANARKKPSTLLT